MGQLSFKQCVLNPSSGWWHSLSVTQESCSLSTYPENPTLCIEGHQRFTFSYVECAELYLFVLLFSLSPNFYWLLLHPGLLGTQPVLFLPEENIRF